MILKANNENKFRFNWVLTNELAIGSAPKNDIALEKLKKEKIKTVISLCSEEESKLADNIQNLFDCKRIILPDHKSGRYPSLDELVKVLDLIQSLKNNGPILVHCVAAMERSPLVCMGWLRREHGLETLEALEYMMEIHKGTSPLQGQLDLLNKLNL
tara:strand:+ start:5150 stop:5620 length:471 start_codon:yes stop_codon:yes gene_type:complete